MMYLQNLCVGEAGRDIIGLGGHTDRILSSETSWRRLDDRFGLYNASGWTFWGANSTSQTYSLTLI